VRPHLSGGDQGGLLGVLALNGMFLMLAKHSLDSIVIKMMQEKLHAALSYNPEGKLRFGSTQGGSAVLMIIKTTVS
jgi:hypothetical protein